MKLCSKCQTSKALFAFNKDRTHRDGLQTVCRECTKAYWQAEYARNIDHHRARSKQQYHANPDGRWRRSLRTLYGITEEQYHTMVKIQDNKCGICGQAEVRYRLSVDHCHTTKKVRGLLCKRCNTVLGLVQENPAILAAAIRYLQETANV